MSKHWLKFPGVAQAGFAVIVFAAVPALSHNMALGQSGKKEARQSPQRSAPETLGPAQVAMEGYCPVCVIEKKQWIKGDPAFQATYDGKTYLFPGEKEKAMFTANPAKYVPALGGDCTVCLSHKGKRVPGSVQHAAFAEGRLYLFPAEKQQQEFLANHEKYAATDLALDGKCSVCRVEKGKAVPGKPEFAEYYQGRRYLFPSPKQQQMFRANPSKYAAPSPSSSR